MRGALNPLRTGFCSKGLADHSGPKVNNPYLVNGKYCSSGEDIGDYWSCYVCLEAYSNGPLFE
jgi:hypothetical protein